MPLLPYLGNTDDTEDWSSLQIYSFAICTYLIISLYILISAVAVHNFLVFVVKGEKCHVVDPLFGFYILSILCLLSDAVYSIFLVKNY